MHTANINKDQVTRYKKNSKGRVMEAKKKGHGVLKKKVNVTIRIMFYCVTYQHEAQKIRLW